MVDIWFEICNHPRMFEWNYMHHWGKKNAKPKFAPTKTIAKLVSTRLEKYRNETKQCLKKIILNIKN